MLVSVLLATVEPVAVAQTQPDIPVAGSFDYSPSRSAEQGVVRGLIHAVRRVPGGTVVYYSIGRQLGGAPMVGSVTLTNDLALGSYRPTDIAYVDVIDPVGLKRYSPMVAGTTCLCSSTSDFENSSPPGKLFTGYVVVPPLPASLTSVSVVGFYGATVTEVPVEDGLLEPSSASDSSIVDLTTGWPTVATDQISRVPNPQKFVLPLLRRTSDIKQTERRVESPTKVSVELAADVLFAVDKAQLSAAAKRTLAVVAKDITARAAGSVTVLGYTDSTGSNARNRTLSGQRAQAVLVALKSAAAGTKATFTAQGKGASDPVATNATTQGRTLNRRVTISYAVTGAK